MKLQDAVIAITGAAQGLGYSIAELLAQQGAKVALIDLNEQALTELTEKLKEQGTDAKYYLCDVASETDVENCFASIRKDFDQLDGLVNNAGILRDGLLLKVKDGKVSRKLELNQWQRVIDVNLTGVFLCGREAAALMVDNPRPSCIINISSVSRAGNIGQSNYSAAKAGVVALTTTWAKELARYNIRSMAIAPGFIETEMTSSMPQEARAHMAKVIPLGKAGQAEHIALTIKQILENDYMTGRVIEVDGGLRI